MRRKQPTLIEPHLARLFANRGRLHAHRYLQTGDRHDLKNAISTMRTAVASAKESQSAVLGAALGNLAVLLLEEAKSTGKDATLNEASQLATWALDCLSDRDPDRARVFATRGNILASQFERSGRPQDLEEAVSSFRRATATWSGPDDDAFPAVVSNNLSCVLGKRYEITGRRKDLNNAITGALDATKRLSADHLPLMPGISSNLASLLARQYESTGLLDCLSNALFELRIVTELAPESPELDVLLRRLGGVAKEQHTLRVQPTVGNGGLLQSTSSETLTLFLLFSLSYVLNGALPGTFYPLVMFMGGIAYNWASQNFTRLMSSPYNTLRFTPTLFSTPWIDLPSDALLTGEKLHSRILTYSMPFESEHDGGTAMKTTTGSTIRNRDHTQDLMEASRRGVYQIQRVSSSYQRRAVTTSPKTKDCDPETHSLKQLPYDHLTDSEDWGDITDSPIDGASWKTPASEVDAKTNKILNKDSCVSETSTEQIRGSEYVKHTVRLLASNKMERG